VEVAVVVGRPDCVEIKRQHPGGVGPIDNRVDALGFERADDPCDGQNEGGRTGDVVDQCQPGARRDLFQDGGKDLVVRAKGKTQSALAAPHETLIGPLGWTWARVSGAFGRWARAAWHNPAPVLFDLAVTLGFVLVSALPETFAAVRMAYPAFGVALFAGLALQLRDPAAVLGLAPHPRSLQGVFVFAIGALAVVIGLVSGPTVTGWFSDGKTRVDMVPLGVSVVLAMAAAVLVGKGAFRTATGTEQAPLNGATARLASIVVTFSLIGLTWVHESWAWVFITDAQRGLGPLSVAMTPVVAGLLIWPARFIFLLRTPFDDGPRWAFVWVMGSLVLFSLTGWA